MTKTEEQIIKYWLLTIARECDKVGVKYGIFIKSNITTWQTDVNKILELDLSSIDLNDNSGQCDINILNFHVGPEDSAYNQIYTENNEYRSNFYWEISFTTLLSPDFHSKFESEMAYRKFVYTFSEHDN